MSQVGLVQLKQTYEIIDALLETGLFPGAHAEAIRASRRHAQQMIQTVQEQINGNKEVQNDRTQEDASGVGASGIPNAGRQDSEQEGN